MPAIYGFGPFRLDVEAGLLFRGSEPVGLGPRAVALLHALVARADAPMSKAALLDAVWPGLTVEESNLPVQIAALRRFLGEEPGCDRWIETLPRRGYRFTGPVTILPSRGPGSKDAGRTGLGLPLPDLPSIAVLPFQNLSGDPEQQYFADGIVEEIITALSRFRQLFVIARNSSFIYDGRTADLKKVGSELGVRYLLLGSVRKASSQIRIAAQLIDGATGKHLWADRFDGALGDIFDLQDHVTACVVGAIAPRLERAEIERAGRKPTESLDTYDLYLRGLAKVHLATREANEDALQLFGGASKLDPDFAPAYAMAAWCYAWSSLNGWASEGKTAAAEATRLADLSAKLGRDDAVALAMAGYALVSVTGDVENTAVLADKALALNPNLAAAWLLAGMVEISHGEPDAAIERIERSMRLSPFDPLSFVAHSLIGLSHFLAGRHDDALRWAERSVREQPNWVPAVRRLAASHAMVGRLPEARQAVERLLELAPETRISRLGESIRLLRRPRDLAKLAEGLRRAGLPE